MVSKSSPPCATTRSVPPRRVSEAASASAQTRSPDAASPVGPWFVITVRVTCPVRASTTEIVPSSVFAAHTSPPATVSSAGRSGSAIFDTAPDVGSTRDSVRSGVFATHTEPLPTATPTGPLPTGTACTTAFDCGSSRSSVPASWLVIQTAPSPYASRVGFWPSGIVVVLAVPVPGAIAVTVASTTFSTQTVPLP
jgi:hypothetical protein